jgi:hypothetical protein
MINRMHKSLRRDIPIIIILFILAIAIQLYFLNPPILSDQMEYYITAVRFPHLPSNPNIGSMRIGLELPVAVLYRIFGSAEVSYYTFPLLSFAVLSISIYLIGRHLFSRRVGLLSALWIMFIPNLLQESGHLLPDVPATACSAAAFSLLFTFFGDKQNRRDLSSRGSTFLLILAGLFFGWSYLVKEYLAILFFLIPMVFWMLEIPYRRMLPVAIAMLAMYGLEVLTGIIYYSNPLIRFLAASPRETEGGIHKDVIKIMTFFGRLLNKSGGEGFLIVMLAGLGNSIYESIKKNKSYLFLLSWILLIYVLFTFAGLLPVIFDWEEIVLMRLHKFRYWIPILPPLVIAGVAFLDKIFTFISSKFKQSEPIKNRFVQSAVVIILCLTSMRGLAVIRDYPDFIRNGYDHYQELRQFLKENDDQIDLIWIDRDNKRSFERILPMYIRGPFGNLIWHGQTKYINTNSLYLRAEEIVDGYIIIDRDFMVPEYNDVPQYLADYPDNWELAFESENEKIALYAVK